MRHGDIQLKSLTPLMLAAPTGSGELVRVLLEAGADVKARDMRGMTPLMIAAASEYQNARIVKLLIDRGSDCERGERRQGRQCWIGRGSSTSRGGGALGEARREGESATGAPAKEGRCAGGCAVGSDEEHPLVQQGSQSFFRQSGCVACHHQPAMATVVKAARSRRDQGR